MSNSTNNKQLMYRLGKTDMYLIDMLQKGYFLTPLKILDAGCGSGRNIPLLLHLNNSVYAVDSNPEVVQELTLKGDEKTAKNLHVGVGEIGFLADRYSSFDMVICNAVLHFAKDKKHFENMVTDLVKILKKGGVLFARFVSSHTLNLEVENTNIVRQLPDGSSRFVVDYLWFKNELVPTLGLQFKEPFKTVNVDGKRTMTTVVLVKE